MKKIKQIAETVPQIVDGVKNYIRKEEHIEQMAKSRMEICGQCDKYNHYSKQCKVCGCFMEFKTRSTTAKCPMEKW